MTKQDKDIKKAKPKAKKANQLIKADIAPILKSTLAPKSTDKKKWFS